MSNGSEDSLRARPPEAQQAYNEAAERQRRLQVWIDAMISGSPLLAGRVTEWRQALIESGELKETPAENSDTEDTMLQHPASARELLLNATHRIRERQASSGNVQAHRIEQAREERFDVMTQWLQSGLAIGAGFTPLHWVFAARYVEGEIGYDECLARMRTETRAD